MSRIYNTGLKTAFDTSASEASQKTGSNHRILNRITSCMIVTSEDQQGTNLKIEKTLKFGTYGIFYFKEQAMPFVERSSSTDPRRLCYHKTPTHDPNQYWGSVSPEARKFCRRWRPELCRNASFLQALRENRYMNLKMKRPLDFHIPDGLLGFAVQFFLSQAGF
jgi:hypothetical protein